jgi:group I intron endonuclease
MKLIEFKPTCGIYRIVNTLDNRSYIGQSREIQVRWAGHIKSLLKGKHSCKDLLDDFQEHGLEIFEVEILEKCEENCDEKVLLKKEEEWCAKFYDQHISLYNLSNDIRIINICHNKLKRNSGND